MKVFCWECPGKIKKDESKGKIKGKINSRWRCAWHISQPIMAAGLVPELHTNTYKNTGHLLPAGEGFN